MAICRRDLRPEVTKASQRHDSPEPTVLPEPRAHTFGSAFEKFEDSLEIPQFRKGKEIALTDVLYVTVHLAFAV